MEYNCFHCKPYSKQEATIYLTYMFISVSNMLETSETMFSYIRNFFPLV